MLDENDNVVEEPFTLARGTIEGEVTAQEPVYPAVTLPPVDGAAETLAWKLSGAVVNNKVQFTINGVPMFVEKPYLQGATQGPWTLGYLPIWFDKEVVVLKH